MSIRALLITELFLPTKGGTAVMFDSDFRRLGGKSVHVVTADVPGASDIDQNHPNTIHRIRLRRIAWARPESVLIYTKLFLISLWLIVARRLEKVLAGRALPEGLVAWIVARITGRKVYIYAHGEELTGWGRGGKFRTMRFVLRRADLVIGNSDFTRDTLVGLIGVPAARVVVLYPAVDEAVFCENLPAEDLREQLGLTSSAKLILSVGRLQRRKGFDNVIRAVAVLVGKGIDVHYALIGIGEDLDYLRRLARENGVSHRVHLLGHVAQDDLPRWYNACDVFAMPNRELRGDTEGFGIVYLEAAASAKPSIAGRAGGTGSAVVDGETGLRVDGDDLSAITAAIERVLSDERLGKRLGQTGRERVLANFTYQRRAEQLRQLIQDSASIGGC